MFMAPQPSGAYAGGGSMSVLTGRDPDWSTHSAPSGGGGGGGGWASSRPADPQSTPTYR